MKNVLLYNYNIDVENLMKHEDGSYSFYIDYEKYYMWRLTRPKEDIEEIYSIIKEHTGKFHTMIINRFQSLFTECDGEIFVLLKIRGPENSEIDMTDIIKDCILIDKNNTILDRRDWAKLWSEKVDYLEYQVSELGKNHPLIRHSFSYFIGLAENAIEYVTLLKQAEAPSSLSRRRIKYPTTSLIFYNPLDIVIDYRVRDLSEYIKVKFYNREDALKEVKILTKKSILSPLEYNLLFARLLYPSNYFDEIYRILEKNKDEEVLLEYIEKVDAYEKFLNEVYTLFSKKVSMIKIDWLIKKS